MQVLSILLRWFYGGILSVLLYEFFDCTISSPEWWIVICAVTFSVEALKPIGEEIR